MRADTLAGIMTPAAVVDVDRMAANLDRMAGYTAAHGLALAPHTKTHKTPELGAEQVRRGAIALTVAQPHEAAVMSAVAPEIQMAYPPVGVARLERLLSVPESIRIRVAVDTLDALEALARSAAERGRTVGVMVEVDAGMHRAGVATPAETVALARRAVDSVGVEYRGVLFYPGHIREAVDAQEPALHALGELLGQHLTALRAAGLSPEIVSGGSTPAAYGSHRIGGVTEIRPGTYIFNDRTTAAVDACAWDDCAYTVLATVVSTAVHEQAVVDAGSKALSREELRGPGLGGFGALLDRPDVVVKALSEEHGLLDLSGTSWRPRVGERVRIVPNHVCVSVNLHEHLWGVRGDEVVERWRVAARGWGG